MRCCGQHDERTLGITRQPGQKIKALLFALVGADAGMCLVDHHHLRAGLGEIVATFFSFDVVQANNRERMHIEQRLRGQKITLKPNGRARGDGDSIDSEPGGQFARPLFDKVGRAENREGVQFTPIHQFPQDQTGFNCFADSHIIGDQQAWHS